MRSPVPAVSPVVALAVSLLLIAMLTLVPQGSGVSEVTQRVWCFPCNRLGVAGAVANVLLFVPLGASLAAHARSVLRATVIGVAVSFVIEAVQFTDLVTGRYTSAVDLVANGLGAFVGAALFVSRRTLLAPDHRVARVLAIGWWTLVVCVLVAGHWLLQRDSSADRSSPNATITSSPLPHTIGFGWFEHEVLSGVVDGVPFAPKGTGALRVSAPLRERHVASVVIRGRDRRDDLVPVLYVHEHADSMAHLLVGQRGEFISLRARLNAARFGMHMPDLVVRDVAARADTAGGTNVNSMVVRTVNVEVAPGRWTLTVRADKIDSEATSFEFTALHSWLLLVPAEVVSRRWVQVGTAMFAMLLLVPGAFWSLRSIRRNSGP